MIISHHKLQGEVVKLKKPFAVLEKKHNPGSTETEYEIVAVLRKKYVFATRPQPLVDEESKGKASCKCFFVLFLANGNKQLCIVLIVIIVRS
jgi:hypothetical protein